MCYSLMSTAEKLRKSHTFLYRFYVSQWNSLTKQYFILSCPKTTGKIYGDSEKKTASRKDAVISWLVCSFFSLRDCNERSWDSPGPKFFLVKIEDCLWYHMLTTCRKPLMQYQGNLSQETFKPRLYPYRSVQAADKLLLQLPNGRKR